MTRLLQGVTVLDLSNVLSGPFCGFQLALLGARVIKIEKAEGGDLARKLGEDQEAAKRLMGATFVAFNAGKESVALNLKSTEGRAVFLQMVERTDVVLENFRPGIMDKLDLGFDTLKAANPRLVYCAISGFGATGPLASRTAYDQIIQGMSGAMSITGDAPSAPLKVGFPISDTIGGLTAAFGIAAALVKAQRTGEGAYLDVSMLESTLATLGWVVSNLINAGHEPRAMGNMNPTSSPSGTFRTADGQINIAANEDHQFRALCRAIDRPDLLDDARFADRHQRKQFRDALTSEIEKALALKSTAEWDDILCRHDIPAGPIYRVSEILAHPQLDEREFVLSIQDGTAVQHCTRGGFMVDGEGPAVSRPAPRLAEHTDEWMHSLGLSATRIEQLRSRGDIA